MTLSTISNNNGEFPRSVELHQPNCLRLHVMLLEIPDTELLKEEFSTIDLLWLRRNSPWPNMVMMVVYRFLHMRNLYQINQGDQINELVDYIFQNGKLPNNQDCRAQMIHRCKKLILSTSKWTSNGILMYSEDNRLVKNAIFQTAWNNQIIIMRNRIKITNKEVHLVEVPNDIPAKVSEPNTVMTDVSVAALNPSLEGRQNSSEMITATEPLIKVDPDGPVDLVEEIKTASRVKLEPLDSEQVQSAKPYNLSGNPKSPMVPVLRDASLNVTDGTYYCSASYCDGLPNLESDTPDSHVPPLDTNSISQQSLPRNDIKAEVIFLKDSKHINYSSEALLSHHTQKFKACAQVTVFTPNKVDRKVVRDAMSLIWESNDELVLFWKSVALQTSTIIKITFPDADWLPGVTVDINSDEDLLRARQIIWNNFWIFIDKQPETIVSIFNINANPEESQLSVVPSKRQRNSIPDDPISVHQEDGTSPYSNDAYDIAFRNCMAKIGSQRSGENSVPREGRHSIGQVPMSSKSIPLLKRPAKRPRLIEQQQQPTTSQTEVVTTTSDPILLEHQVQHQVQHQIPQHQILQQPIPQHQIPQQQIPQQKIPQYQTHQQEHDPRPIKSLASSHILGSAYNPQPQQFIQAQPFQPSIIHTQPRASVPLTETSVFHHEPNNSFASYAHQISPRTNRFPHSQTLPVMSPAPTTTQEDVPYQRIPRMTASPLATSYQHTPYNHAPALISHPETMAGSQRSSFSAHYSPQMPIPRLNHHTPTFNHPAFPPPPSIIPQSHCFPTYAPSNPTPTPTPNPTPTPTIQLRIQLQPNGPFSAPYPKYILGIRGKPGVTTSQFFTWFIAKTHNPSPGKNIDSLTFRFKDAVPVPLSYTISRTGMVDEVDAMVKLRTDIVRECENAGRLVMGLEKFEIFVSITEEGSNGKDVELLGQVSGEEW
ncbi:hypothetical protein BOTCAL_0196g00070 [Botryotinia calthae]|uniref:Uncharacterized protein n=1 Tax=Botryotinia calthae TaxID=38488 RepID=A0A4Y8CZK1_9HELO|nr:hypothetical protein BOTCAL_0196g00070 [Botryotinia calthae]